MRALLSTIGSRGDVQPLVALALTLRELGAEARLCVPPDFCAWIEGLGLPVTPIGPAVRATARPAPAAAPPSPEQLRAIIEGTLTTQFETIAAAAQGCDVIVGASALQIAAPSVAEQRGVPYVFVAYCPCVLPSDLHAPPVLPMRGDTPVPPGADLRALWERDARRWNDGWGPPLAVRRAALRLPPIEDVRRHVLTDRPWLASDPILSPWPASGQPAVHQTGAWILPDARPLAAALAAFLDAGDPPIYVGFGSVRAPAELARAAIDAARAHGRRVILSRGWAELTAVDDGADCLVVDEVNQQALFPRCAVVVHHGGAGTVTAAAAAGAPQVVVPQLYDQHYWAARVEALGLGVAHPTGGVTAASLGAALDGALAATTSVRAGAIAAQVWRDGAAIAARRLFAV